MNTFDILKYGNLTLLNALGNIPFKAWGQRGVCGVWSVKNILAHLESYEQWHIEVLQGVLGMEAPTPIFDARVEFGDSFNDVMVEQRAGMSPEETLEAYKQGQATVMALVERVPEDRWVENGTLPWYGLEYCLNDFFVYTSYGHKREHSAQVDVYRDRLEGKIELRTP